MKDIDRATALIFSLAEAVVVEMRTGYPTWLRAFVRFKADDACFEVKCSYVLPDSVCILDVLSHDPFIRNLQQAGLELRQATSNEGREFSVALLRVESDLSCEMQYEYNDPDRWAISKLRGGSGLPSGYTSA